MILDYKKHSVRGAAILTTSYVAGTVIDAVNDHNQLLVEVDFTKGSLTTAEIKIEFSEDGTNWYQETFSSISAGTSTETLGEHAIAATGKYVISAPIKSNKIRISAKGTGTVTGSSMAIQAITGRS